LELFIQPHIMLAHMRGTSLSSTKIYQ